MDEKEYQELETQITDQLLTAIRAESDDAGSALADGIQPTSAVIEEAVKAMVQVFMCFERGYRAEMIIIYNFNPELMEEEVTRDVLGSMDLSKLSWNTTPPPVQQAMAAAAAQVYMAYVRGRRIGG